MSRKNRILSALGVVVVLILAILLGERYITVERIVSSARRQDNLHNFKGHGDGPVIGIEFGNDTFRMGVQRNGTFEIIPDAQGRIETPSCVFFRKDHVLVGHEATGQLLLDPENTVCGIRQLIGREFSEHQLRQDIKQLPYRVKNKNGKPVIQVLRNGVQKLYTPQEILAESLRKLKADAEAYLDGPVASAVITVPLHFNDIQQHATADAGSLAGLNILRLVKEATAAGVAHKVDQSSVYIRNESHVLVYGIQETTLSVVVGVSDIEVYGTLADTITRELGGRDLDSALLQLMIAKYEEAEHQDITKDAGAMGRLHYEIRKAEGALAANTSAEIKIQPRKNAFNFSEILEPNTFHDLHRQFFERTTSLIEQALNGAEVGKENIRHIIMTGDPARTSKLRPFLAAFLDGKEILDEFDSDEAFVRGAALISAIFSGEEPNVSSFDHGTTALSLGVGTADGTVKVVIERDTVTPTHRRQVFTTVMDNQSYIILELFEGARPMIKDNKYIGMLELSDIRQADAGVPRIEVVFKLDPASTLTAVARELGTRNEMQLTISPSQGDKYYKMVKAMLVDAETNYEQDLEAEKTAVSSRNSRPVNPVGVVLVDHDQ